MLLPSGKCRVPLDLGVVTVSLASLTFMFKWSKFSGQPELKSNKAVIGNSSSFTCGLDTAGHSHAWQNSILDSVLRSPLASNLGALLSQRTVR